MPRPAIAHALPEASSMAWRLLPAGLGPPLLALPPPPLRLARCMAALQANLGWRLRDAAWRTAVMWAGSGCLRGPAELELLLSPWSPQAGRALPCMQQQPPALWGHPSQAGQERAPCPRGGGSAGTLLSEPG